MKTQLPAGTTFTTLAINFNVPMQCHRDSNNKPGAKAYIMGLGNYVGGGLWCHAEAAEVDKVFWKKFQGKWLPGRVHNIYHNLVAFDPCRWHQPQTWEGRRIAISAYTVNCAENCSDSNRDLLQALGFPLPPALVRARPEGGGAVERNQSAPKSLLRPRGALRSMCATFSSSCGGGHDSSVPGEQQTSESPQVAGGEGRGLGNERDSLVPGEQQTSESPQVAGGEGRESFQSQCTCKGFEVDPSLCTCRASTDQVVSRGGTPGVLHWRSGVGAG